MVVVVAALVVVAAVVVVVALVVVAVVVFLTGFLGLEMVTVVDLGEATTVGFETGETGITTVGSEAAAVDSAAATVFFTTRRVLFGDGGTLASIDGGWYNLMHLFEFNEIK